MITNHLNLKDLTVWMFISAQLSLAQLSSAETASSCSLNWSFSFSNDEIKYALSTYNNTYITGTAIIKENNTYKCNYHA